MAPQFFSREIKVTVSGELKVPISFRLHEREYVISDILQAWHDYGFGRSPLRHRKWWLRRHRNYYRVRTTEGEVFETAKLYVLQLKTPDVIIQNKEPGSFVEDLEYLITKFTKFMDDLIDELMLTDFAEILGNVLAKLMVLLAEVRGMVGPYIP